MSSTTPARPMSCRCPARQRTAFAPPAAAAPRAPPARRPRRSGRACSATSCRRIAHGRGSRSPASSPDRRIGSPGLGAITASYTDGTSSTANSSRRVTAEDVDQLRIVAVSARRAHQRDGSSVPNSALRRLRIGGELHQPHRRSIASPLSCRGRPSRPSARTPGHGVATRRRQAQPLGQQPPDLAVPARHRRHAGQLAQRAHHLAQPPREASLRPMLVDHRAQHLAR